MAYESPQVKHFETWIHTGFDIVAAITTQLTLFHVIARILRTTAHHAHGKDGVVRDLGVSVMGKLAEGVQDIETRVRHGYESQGEGHCSPQGGLTIAQLME